MATPDDSKNIVPKAADHDQLTNRMNMALSKRSALMTSLRGPNHAKTTAQNSSSSNGTKSNKQQTSNSTTPKPTTSASFSSLLSSGSSKSKQPSKSAKQQQPQNTKTSNDDDDLEHFGGYNQGLGFASKPDQNNQINPSDDAVIRDLRGKLLGKRAREQKEEAAARKGKKGRMMTGRKGKGKWESSSDEDEEEGRSSAVAKKGRGKK